MGLFIIFAVFIATIAMIINAMKSALISVRCGLFKYLRKCRITRKSRLGKLVLVPLLYGNKDINRNNLSQVDS